MIFSLITVTLRFLWRLYLLLKERSGLAVARPIPSLNRKKIKQNIACDPKFVMDAETDVSPAITLTSGRVIRKVKGAPQLQKRNWKLPVLPEENIHTKTKLQGLPLVGEVLLAVNNEFFNQVFSVNVQICHALCHLKVMSIRIK